MRNKHSHRAQVIRKVKKGFLQFTGGTALLLGVVGIVIPMLPTTPFLLLSASCFLKSSLKAHRWLMENHFLGPTIYQYKVTRKLTKKAKIRGLFFLWVSMILSIVLIDKLFVVIVLLSIAAAVTLHLMSFKTMSKEEYRSFMDEYTRFISSDNKDIT